MKIIFLAIVDKVSHFNNQAEILQSKMAYVLYVISVISDVDEISFLVVHSATHIWSQSSAEANIIRNNNINSS
jgi:hypothetical protein